MSIRIRKYGILKRFQQDLIWAPHYHPDGKKDTKISKVAQPKSKGCQQHSYCQTSSPSQSSALSTKLSFTGSQFFNLKRLCLPPQVYSMALYRGPTEARDFIAFKVLKVLQGHFLIKPHPSWNLVWLYNKSIHPATSPKTSVWVNYKTLSLWQFTSTLLSVISTCTSCFGQWIPKFQW